MKLILAFLLMNLAAVAVRVAADDPPVISPGEAKEHVGNEVRVEMTVRAAKKALKRQTVFLDSERNFQDPDNLGLALTERAADDLRLKHNAADLVAFILEKRIRVRGTVVRREERIYIDVDNADQIELLRE